MTLTRSVGIGLWLCLAAQTMSGVAPSPPPSSASGAEDFAREAYVVEESKTVVRFEADGTGRREVYERINVHSDAGVEKWGQLTFPYTSATERMTIASVNVRKRNGTVVAAPAEAVQDLSSPVERIAPVYTDTREKHVTVPGLRPGDILEFTVVTDRHTPIAPGEYWMEYDFVTQAIVLDEKLEIDVPSKRRVTLKTRDGFDPAVVEENGRRVYRWQRSNLTVNRDDDKRAAHLKAVSDSEPAAVRLTTFSDWQAVGQWYHGIETPQRSPTPEIRRKAAELTAGSTSEVEKLEALYDFVAQNFRYVSLSFGVGRYQPHAAADVLRNQYGDCKDKHTLLASLVESAGMRASTVLANSHAKVDPDFPSPSQFDHVMTRVAVGGNDIWLDTTLEVAPFSVLAPQVRNKPALIVGADDSAAHLETVPAKAPVSSSMLLDIDGTLSDAGIISAHVHMALRGDAELLFRTYFRRTPKADWPKMIEGLAERAGLGKVATEWKVSDPAGTRDPFVIDYQSSKANFVSWAKKKFDLEFPSPNWIATREPADADGAASPIEIGPPRLLRYKLRLELPRAYTAHPPIAVKIGRGYADYRADYVLEGTVLRVERVLDIRELEVPAALRDDYRSFRRAVSQDIDQVLTVETHGGDEAAPAESLTSEELYDSGIDALDAGRFALAAKLLERVVALEPSHKWAWNKLGRAYLGLHQVDQAIGALKTQIGINPYDPYAYNNLGLAYGGQRKFAEAETAYRKQIDINPLDQFAHANLGRMYLEWRKYAEAAAELEKAVTITPRSATLEIRLGEAYLNMRQTDRARAAFDRAIDFDPTPLTWNDISYRYALQGVELDRAQRLAESAVAAMGAETRNLDVDNPTPRDLWRVASIASYWDTLGWVYRAKGQPDRAEKFVRSSWVLAQHPEVGDHLGQIYEKQGRREDAIRAYARALDTEFPDAVTRARLVALAGEDRVDAIVRQHRGEAVQLRTIDIGAKGPAGTSADFFVLFGSDAHVEAVKFIAGDEAFRPFADRLRNLKYDVVIPDDSPVKLLRRGTVSCPPQSERGTCKFVLLLPAAAQDIQQR